MLPKSSDHSKHHQEHSTNNWIRYKNKNCAKFPENSLNHHDNCGPLNNPS